jgi:K+-transporting ATPase ATPase C chain
MGSVDHGLFSHRGARHELSNPSLVSRSKVIAMLDVALIADTDPNDSTKTVPAPCNAANSAGSNLRPTSQALVDRVKDDAEKLKAENPSAPLPVDLVTTWASGLDPDITPAAAEFQVPRVAKARNLSPDKVRTLVADMTQDRFLGILGEKRVNVLKVNMALDALAGSPR